MRRFALGLVLGVVASISFEGRGDGFGDRTYVYYAFAWRGRSFEFHVHDREDA